LRGLFRETGSGAEGEKGRSRASVTIPQKPSVISLSLSVSRYPARRRSRQSRDPPIAPLSPFVPSSAEGCGMPSSAGKNEQGKVGISGLSGKVSAAPRRSRPPFYKIDARRVHRFIAETSVGIASVCFFGRGRTDGERGHESDG